MDLLAFEKTKLSYLFQKILRQLHPIDPGCPHQLLLSFLLPALGQEPAGRLGEVPGTDRLVTDTLTLITATLTLVTTPVEDSPNDGQRTEEHHQQNPPVGDQVGNSGQNHQAGGGHQHDGRRAQCGLGRRRPLQTLDRFFSTKGQLRDCGGRLVWWTGSLRAPLTHHSRVSNEDSGHPAQKLEEQDDVNVG